MKCTDFEEGVWLKYRAFLMAALKDKFRDVEAAERIKSYEENYHRIIDEIPDDGGVTSPNHHNIPEAAAVIAFYIASDRVFGAEGTIKLFEEAMMSNEQYDINCRKVGKAMFTKEWQEDRKGQALRSLNNPNGFQLRFIEGNVTEYFGVDYLKCPIVDMVIREKVQELQAPLCTMDYFFAEHMGFRLERTKTLGTGGDFCDFRYFSK